MMDRPLSGMRVLDLSIFAAGPWAGALLGELGAEVIKVESPAGDGTRWVQPLQRGMGTNYISMNVNKRGVILDLKDPAGKQAALDLVATSDVFLQNFRVGVLDRLGLGYEHLSKINPRLVYCSISGFGSRGPLSEERCMDYIMQAFSGFARLNGTPGRDVEQFRFTGFLDLTTSIVATEAILVALLEREESGLGQHVDVSMLEAALEMQFTRVAEMLLAGEVAYPRGSESPNLVPDRAFGTLDREVFVTVHDEEQWRRFCEAIRRPDLSGDQRFSDNPRRVANRQALNALLEPVFAVKPAIWWLRTMERHGVPAGLAQHFEVFRHHTQVIENDMIAHLDTRWGHILVGGLPWHFSRTPCEVMPPPTPGEHTNAVLAGLRGMTKGA